MPFNTAFRHLRQAVRIGEVLMVIRMARLAAPKADHDTSERGGRDGRNSDDLTVRERL
jgi:hypothetical protein